MSSDSWCLQKEQLRSLNDYLFIFFTDFCCYFVRYLRYCASTDSFTWKWSSCLHWENGFMSASDSTIGTVNQMFINRMIDTLENFRKLIWVKLWRRLLDRKYIFVTREHWHGRQTAKTFCGWDVDPFEWTECCWFIFITSCAHISPVPLSVTIDLLAIVILFFLS